MNRYLSLSTIAVVIAFQGACSSTNEPSPPGSAAEAVGAGQSCIPSTPIEGVDVSEHNGDIDWPTLAARGGITFAFIKATQGSSYVDPQFANNWPGANKAGVI